MWTRFSEIFGKRFLEEFGEEPPKTWQEEMGSLNAAQIRHGVQYLIRSGAEHPPSLAHFAALCRNQRAVSVSTHAPSGWNGDNWDIESNHHFLAYLLRRVYERNAQLDSEQTKIFIEFKKLWARDMREGFLDQSTGEIKPPTIEQQKSAWLDCMQRAQAAA